MDTRALRAPMEFLLVGAAVESGLMEAWREGTGSATGPAASLGLDRRAVWTVAEALTTLGYLEREGEEGYRLSAAAREVFYRPESDRYEGLAFMHQYEICKGWVQLPAVLRSGRPAPRERNAATNSYFMQAMTRSSKGKTGEIAGHCLAGLKPGARVLDVGGGPLNFARAFAALGAAVVVLDLPGIVAVMSPALAPEENIRMKAGDFTEGLPPGPFDLVFLSSVTHIYGEAENRLLFRRAAGVLAPGGRIAVADFVRGANPYAALFAVNMLVNTGTGGTWTREEYAAWLAGAGFVDTAMADVNGRQLITAVRA